MAGAHFLSDDHSQASSCGMRSQQFFYPLVVALIRFFCCTSKQNSSSLCSTAGDLYILASSIKQLRCCCKTSKLLGEASWTSGRSRGWQTYILADRSELLKSKLLILTASTFFIARGSYDPRLCVIV